MMLRNYMREVVLGRLLLAFIIGIVLASLLPFNLKWILCIGVIWVLVILIHSYFAHRLNGFTFHWLNGLSINLIFIYCGCLLTYSIQNGLSPNHFSKQKANNITLIIKDDISNNNLNNRYLADILFINDIKKTHGKILIYAKSKKLQLGSVLKINANIIPFQKNRNPGEFNAQAFWKKKQVFHFLFLNEKDTIIGFKALNFFKANSLWIAYKFDSILKKNLIDEESYRIASALLIGSRVGISEDVISDYSKTGTIHILSVSGLHVSIIFLVLNKFLSIFRWGKTKLIKSIILIGFVCLYAYITGLSPSVCRSAVMISFSIIGKQINQQSNPYNLIAGSALLLLIIDPFYLYDIGFQLSYFAVLGIIYFYQAIYELIYIENKLLNQVWMLIAVSISAQLSTLPMALYYFHQFPNYFLLANLLAIPLSSIALYLGIALLAFNPITIVSKYIGFVLSKCIGLMGYLLHKISILPNSLSFYHHLNLTSSILLFIAILCLSFYVIHHIKWFNYFGLFFVMILALNIFLTIRNEKEKLLYVIHQNDSPSILIKQSNHYTLICTRSNNVIKLNRLIQNFNKIGWKLDKLIWVNNKSVVTYQRCNYLFLDKIKNLHLYQHTKPVDYLLCADYLTHFPEKLALHFITNKSLIGIEKKHFNCYSTYDSGAQKSVIP
jgi:competence protein ComEC